MTDFPTGEYDILLVDPPWPYRDRRTRKSAGMAGAHYPPMDPAALALLPIKDLCAPRAHLCLWATGPKLPLAMRMLGLWGFEYCTVLFTWNKVYRNGRPYSGLGHHTKSGSEFVLLGRLGRPLPRLRRDVKQVVTAPVTRHSAKPPEVRDRIVALYGDRPRIELFARERASGWDAWGNEL